MTVYVDNYRRPTTIGRLNGRWSHLTADTPTELHTFAGRLGLRPGHHVLVVPYYATGVARPVGQPLDTVTSHDRVARPTAADTVPVTVDDCWFRMLKPRESQRAQRFPDTYTVTGNQAEQTMQAGNAVSANVAQWICQRLAAALGAAA